VAMVETDAALTLPAPDYRGFSPFPGPTVPAFTGATLDVGVAVVTSKRIILVGRHRREWQYAKLLGAGYLPDNRTTLMRVSNRVKLSGLATEPAATTTLRFNLALALADFAGHRAGFVTQLERQIEEHQRYRPRPPESVTPQQAPLTAIARPPVVAGVAVAAILLLCGLIGFLAPKPAAVPSHPASGAGTVAVASLPASAAAPASSAATAAALPDGTPSAAYSPPAPAPVPARPPAPAASPRRTGAAPKPKPVSLCGAPANPYDYNYCGRGSKIYAPKPDICDYFKCIDNFGNGTGYMIECSDGMVSMSGGRRGSCSHHGGNKQSVYDG
jgi:hypothetical protein